MEYESEGLLTKRGQDNNAACLRLEIEAERLMTQVTDFCKGHGISPQVAWDAKKTMISKIDPHQHFANLEHEALTL